MKILKERNEESKIMRWLSPFLAFGLMLAFGGVTFHILGVAAIEGMYVFFIEPLTTLRGWSECLLKTIPIALCAMGLAFCFRANLWNIGAEGQLLMGGIGASIVAIWFGESEGLHILPLVLLGGILGGVLWALIPALLRNLTNASEILTSLMLTYVAALLLRSLLYGPLKAPDSYNFPESSLFGDAALVPILLEGTRLHWGFVVMLVLLGLCWILMARHHIAYQLKVFGNSPKAAEYAGFHTSRIVWICFAISGGFAGLAGAFEVAGPIGQLVPVISPGYGFTAIIVALLGSLHPFGILMGSFVLSLTYIGGENAQIALNMPSSVVGVFQGSLLLFLLSCRTFVHYSFMFRPKAAS